MIHILIIDDEIHAVRGLEFGVQWDRLGIQRNHIHVAYSVKQGQELFKQYPISILLCDIEMPQLTGIDMQVWVKEHYPNVCTIFLTCHADFSYVQRALQLNSLNYLLKPVDYEELEHNLRSAIKKSEEQKSTQVYEQMYEKYRQLWESKKPIIAERFWQSLFKHAFPSTLDVIKEELKYYGLEYKANVRYVPMLLKIKKWNKNLGIRDEQIIKYAIRNAAMEGMKRFVSNIIPVTLEENNGLLLLLELGEEERIEYDQYIEASEEFIQFSKANLYCEVCSYIGSEVKIYKVFDELQSLTLCDKNNVVHLSKVFKLNEWKELPSEIPKVAWSKWVRFMKAQEEKQLLIEITSYFEDLRINKGYVNANYVELFYEDFLQHIYTYLFQVGVEVNQVFDKKGLTREYTQIVKTLDTLEEWVIYIVQVAMNRVGCIKKNMSVVEKAAQYIRNHIGMQDISREDIAKHVFLNPDYLTRIFKKETGMSISDYMQLCRLNYAKELLTDTNCTISEIAVTVGYSNISYFSTLFKKSTCLNPIDYRKMYRHNKLSVSMS